MNNTNFLEKLLDGERVEWKRLGEVCGLITTGKLNANAMEEGGNYPFFTCNEKPYKINSYAFDLEAILISGNGSQVGHLNYYKGKFNAYQRTYIVGDFRDVNAMYLFHYLNYTLKSYILQNSRKGSIPYITMPMLEGFQILIPCPDNPKKSLEIQAEIVRILDNFTTLTAELTAELTARKKQYAYYREQLLTFGEGEVEWKRLGEVLIRSKGTQITAGKMRQLHKDGAPIKIFAGGRTIAFVNFDDIPAKDINNKPSIIVKSRGIIAFEYYEKPFSHKNEMWSYYSDNKNIDIKFVYYFLKLNEQHFQNIGSKMQMPQIATPDTDKFKIPIPPLSQQARIVAILDKFDAITNSITEGLPREIELRQQQYEYYRDLLLSSCVITSSSCAKSQDP